VSEDAKWTINGPKSNPNIMVSPRVEITRSVEGLYLLDYYAEYSRNAERTSAFTFWGAKKKAHRIIKKKLKFRETVAKEWKKKS
jgi:hypothetical protein